MKAMILAAGFGTRLKPLTDTCPKPLIDVGGKPMIAYPLDLVRRAGITEVAVNLHHLGERIRETLGQGETFGVRITYFEEDPILDTGGGIAAARPFLDGDDFVVLNADTLTDLPLVEMIAFHRKRRAAATMYLRSDAEAERYGVIEIDKSRRIRRFLGLPTAAPGPLQALMFAGVHVLSPRVFDYLPPGIYSITRDTYPRMLAAGEPLYGFVYDGRWQLLDTHEGLAAGRAAMRRPRNGERNSN